MTDWTLERCISLLNGNPFAPVTELQKELDMLRRKAAALDWLETEKPTFFPARIGNEHLYWSFHMRDRSFCGEEDLPLLEAIEAAMEEKR